MANVLKKLSAAPESPTAQQSDAEVHVTPKGTFSCVMLVKTMDQAAPLQCSTSVWGEDKSVLYWPTAQQSEAEVHVTPRSWLSCLVLALGELTMDHVGPFQCWMSVG